MKTTGRTLALIAAVAMLFAFAAAPAQAASDNLAIAKAISGALADVAEKSGPGVVHVKSIRTMSQRAGLHLNMPKEQEEMLRRFFGRPNGKPDRKLRIPSQGSGFILADGHVVTNNHVVDGAKDIKVILADKRTFEAELVGKDSKTDIAVLKIKDPDKDLPAIDLGDSDKVRVGEMVIAIGAPFGLEKTVTSGIISAKGRVVGLAEYEDYIQTDAVINPGNSGGPLLNLDGQVIGINTAISSTTGSYAGVGFAIPINMAKRIVDQLIEKGEVVRGWIGVSIQNIEPDIAEHIPGYKGEGGVLIPQVGPDMPADKAGMKPGDVILTFNGETVESSKHLRSLVAAAEVGKKAPTKVLRDGKEIMINIVPGEQPERLSLVQDGETEGGADKEAVEDASDAAEGFGFEVKPLTDEMRKRFGYEEQNGIIVTDVDPESPAAEKGLRRGMLILEIERQPITSMADFAAAMKEHGDKKMMLMRIKAGDAARYIVIKQMEKDED